MNKWTDKEVRWLVMNYPKLGKQACAKKLGRSEGSIRWKAAELGLRQDHNSEFSKDWKDRAAKSKIGKKRPAQAKVMKDLHEAGKLDHHKDPEWRAGVSRRQKEWHKSNNHPRGMKGKAHKQETKKVLSKRAKDMWAGWDDDRISEWVLKGAKTKESRGLKPPPRPNTTWKAGWRVVAGRRIYFRSRWEANFGRVLQWLKEQGEIKEWEHEPETFWFDGIKRGCVSYLPDFRVTENNGVLTYYEVKGWFDKRSKTKLKRMKKYHPSIKLIVVDTKAYKKHQQQMQPLIPEWES